MRRPDLGSREVGGMLRLAELRHSQLTLEATPLLFRPAFTLPGATTLRLRFHVFLLVRRRFPGRYRRRFPTDMADDLVLVEIGPQPVHSATEDFAVRQERQAAGKGCRTRHRSESADQPEVQIGQEPLPEVVRRRKPEETLREKGPQKGVVLVRRPVAATDLPNAGWYWRRSLSEQECPLVIIGG